MFKRRRIKTRQASFATSLTLVVASIVLGAPVALADDAPVKSSGIDADMALGQKISVYIDCINRHSNWTLGSRARYLDWVTDPKRGPTGREPVIYGLYPLYDAADCQEGIVLAAKLPPSVPEIEQSATTWIDAFAALNTLVADANTYYELENYKDDKMAKGKTLHPQLMEAFARFDATNDALYAQVVATQDELAERRLQRLATDPALKADFLLAVLNDRAKRIVRLMDTVGTKQFDRDGYAAAVADYEKAYFEAEAYTRQSSAQAQSAFDSMLMMTALDLLKAAKAVMRQERDGFRFSSGERMFIEDGSGEMVEGHPKHLVEKYNRFVASSNRSSR